MRFESQRLQRAAMAALAMALWLFTTTPPAQAGCGCDHPPPDWAMVMPSFGSHGKTLTLFPDGFEFKALESYEVVFRDHTGATRTANGYSEIPALINVRVPGGLTPGPVEITVVGVKKGKAKDYTYPSSLFTAMTPAPMIPTTEGVYEAKDFEGAVTADGTLLVSFNLSDILDATQFAYQFTNLPLTFGPDDVLFYNEDGVDLTLFTLSVADEVEHEWGSYYGWNVEDDSGLDAVVYENKVLKSAGFSGMSDILTYWRHEFHTYYQAHLPGASHEVKLGMHPDGTIHINHDHLVLAISGKLRDAKDPENPDKVHKLTPGHVVFDLALGVQPSDDPIEPAKMIEMFHTAERQPLVPEKPTVYDVRLLDGRLLGGSVEPVKTLETDTISLPTAETM